MNKIKLATATAIVIMVTVALGCIPSSADAEGSDLIPVDLNQTYLDTIGVESSGRYTLSGGYAYTLIDDLNLGSNFLYFAGNGSLDLAGNSITSTSNYAMIVAKLNNEGQFTVTDSDNDGTVSGTTAGVNVTSELTISGGTFSGRYGAFISESGGDLTINGGTLKGSDYGIYQNAGSCTVIDGTILGTTSGIQCTIINEFKGDKYVPPYLEVNGGTITGATGIIIGGRTIETNAYISTLYITNGTVTGTNGSAISGNGLWDNTEITIENGTFSAKNNAAIYHPQEGTLTINGGNFTSDCSGIQFCGPGSLMINDAIVTVTGTFTEPSKPNTQTDGAVDDGAAISIINRGSDYLGDGAMEVTIRGGTFSTQGSPTVQSYWFAMENGSWTDEPNTEVIDSGLELLKIANGEFTSAGSSTFNIKEDDKGSIDIIGGTFRSSESKDASVSELLENSSYSLSSNGKVVLSDPDDAVASIEDGSTFASINDAILAAEDRDTVTIVGSNISTDFLVQEDVIIPSGVDIILNLNGFTLQNTNGSNTHTIDVLKDGKVTIRATNGGVVDCTVHAKAALNIRNGGEAVVESGLFIRSNEKVDQSKTDSWTHTWYVVNNLGTLTIDGGTFVLGYPDPENPESYVVGNVSSVLRNGNSDTDDPGTIVHIRNAYFYGGAVIIKNESGDIMEIIGSELTMDNTKTKWIGGNNIIQNYGSIGTINGCTFTALGNDGSGNGAYSDYNRYGISNNGSIDRITDTTISMQGSHNVLFFVLASNAEASTTTIDGDTEFSTSNEGEDNYVFWVLSPENGNIVSVLEGNYSGPIYQDSTNQLILRGGTYSDTNNAKNYLGPGTTIDENGKITSAPSYSASLPEIGITISEGQSTTITLTENNVDPTETKITYTWFANGVEISGETNNCITVSPSTTTIYQVHIVGTHYGESVDVLTNTYTVTVKQMVTITFLGPGGQSLGSYNISEGSKLTNVPEFTGTPDPGYQFCWMSEGVVYDPLIRTYNKDVTYTQTIALESPNISVSLSGPLYEGGSITAIVTGSHELTGLTYTYVCIDPNGNYSTNDSGSFKIDVAGEYIFGVFVTDVDKHEGYNIESVTVEYMSFPTIPDYGDSDDDYVPIVPVVPEHSTSDDDTVKIVACAAAAVVAAIMAAFLILGHRKD